MVCPEDCHYSFYIFSLGSMLKMLRRMTLALHDYPRAEETNNSKLFILQLRNLPFLKVTASGPGPGFPGALIYVVRCFLDACA